MRLGLRRQRAETPSSPYAAVVDDAESGGRAWADSHGVGRPSANAGDQEREVDHPLSARVAVYGSSNGWRTVSCNGALSPATGCLWHVTVATGAKTGHETHFPEQTQMKDTLALALSLSDALIARDARGPECARAQAKGRPPSHLGPGPGPCALALLVQPQWPSLLRRRPAELELELR